MPQTPRCGNDVPVECPSPSASSSKRQQQPTAASITECHKSLANVKCWELRETATDRSYVEKVHLERRKRSRIWQCVVPRTRNLPVWERKSPIMLFYFESADTDWRKKALHISLSTRSESFWIKGKRPCTFSSEERAQNRRLTSWQV